LTTFSAPAFASRPIGVFDSGVGGLSVLRALRAELPLEQYIYVADSGHAPYGERDDVHVIARSQAITQHLIDRQSIKALVVACNTATAAAIRLLRTQYPGLPIVGIEPALKPAAALSKTGVIGVMATRGTLNSEKFRALLDSLQGQGTFVLQPCDGLADAIEHSDAIKTEALCEDYTRAMGQFGTENAAADMLVLGCTHYPFVERIFRELVGPDVRFLEGGAPVARQTRRLLTEAGTLASPATGHLDTRKTKFFSTGQMSLLEIAIKRWLGEDAEVAALSQD
jgi:glutamate racemase